MLEITTCPTCSSKRIRRIRQNWKDEYQGAVYEVPDLEYYECPDCGEKIYDRRAMRKIEAHSPVFSRPALQQKSA